MSLEQFQKIFMRTWFLWLMANFDCVCDNILWLYFDIQWTNIYILLYFFWYTFLLDVGLLLFVVSWTLTRPWITVCYWVLLTHILPMLHFCTIENVRKPSVFWRFQGVQKWNIGRIWVKLYLTLLLLYCSIEFHLIRKFDQSPWCKILWIWVLKSANLI